MVLITVLRNGIQGVANVILSLQSELFDCNLLGLEPALPLDGYGSDRRAGPRNPATERNG